MIETLASLLLQRGWMLVTAESCTGGSVASLCTDLAGSSHWFERGMVTYSNEAKQELLGVDPLLIQTHGAVSEAVARAMALGASAVIDKPVVGVAGGFEIFERDLAHLEPLLGRGHRFLRLHPRFSSWN